MLRFFSERATFKHRSVAVAAALIALSCALLLFGCATDRSPRNWRIGVSFEDETSCGHYRSLQIFDDGHIDYKINHLPEYSRTLQATRADVAHLVNLVKKFPVQLSNFGDHAVTHRGTDADLRLLKDELTRIANITWDDLSAAQQGCAQSPRALPSGRISLLDDY